MPSRRKLITKSSLESPADLHRARSAALASMRSATFGSSLGQLFETGRIAAAEYAAGRRWAELTSLYSAAQASPRQPKTVSLDLSGSAPADPDSDVGKQQAHRDRCATSQWLEAGRPRPASW